MTLERIRQRAGDTIPDLDPVPDCRCKRLPVRAERDAAYAGQARFKRTHALAGDDILEINAGPVPDRDRVSVRTQSESEDGRRLVVESADVPTILKVPHSYRLVLTDGEEELAVFAEGHRSDYS